MPCAAGIEARHDGAEQEASLVIGENVAAQAKAGIVVIAPHVGVPEIDESAWDRLACAGQNEAGKLDRLPRNARLAEITALRRSGFEEGSLGFSKCRLVVVMAGGGGRGGLGGGRGKFFDDPNRGARWGRRPGPPAG